MTDSDIKRIRPQVIALGSLYRLLADHLGLTPNDITFDNACMYPFRTYGQLVLKIVQKGDMTNDLQHKIQSLSDILDFDDMSNLSDVALPNCLQGDFLIGYFAGYKSKKDKPTLALFRKRSGLTQTQLADKIGVSQVAIARWETGKGNPTPDNLKQLCEVLQCTPDDLLGT